MVVVEPLNLELLNGLNGLNTAKRLNVWNDWNDWNRGRGCGGEGKRIRYVERTQQNPYGLVVSSVEQTEIPIASFPNQQFRR